MKRLLKKFLPASMLLFYHKILAVCANLFYFFPSRHLKVIGVTGTNGKTTTCNLIWQILTESGFKVGLTTSINFKIGEKSWVNLTKQGMQGRFRLQQLLRQMARAGCQYAVIETTSEGIKQCRHWGINYKVAVFTNLTPEHIEAHRSFENYKQAKGQLFAALKGKGISIVNLDDEHAGYFLGFGAKEKWGYGMEHETWNMEQNYRLLITNYQLFSKGAEFAVQYDGQEYQFKTNLLGQFNIYNCLAAIAVGLSQKIEMKVIQEALEKTKPVAGRMEVIYDKNRDLTVIVDYAHDPAALENVYEAIKSLEKANIIAVLGAVGGGRDKAKRPKLGALASKYAQYVIITNEDPYDDDPREIMNQVEAGVKDDPKRKINQNYWMILDRREAIKKAVELACSGDIIALTGKGCEEVMAVKGGFIPWDDRKVAREVLEQKN
ncbi:MAG: UDP-N-acetylmuramoyl-L-alanyl-D-glutamate--2,6-diaminopimelate ligase [Candidatus Jacksonbacteria bacterium]